MNYIHHIEYAMLLFGLSRVKVPQNHNVSFTLVSGFGLNEGIDAVLNMLHRCWFDEEKCAKGISSLDSYINIIDYVKHMFDEFLQQHATLKS